MATDGKDAIGADAIGQKFAEDVRAERAAFKKGHLGEAWNHAAYAVADELTDMARGAEQLREKAISAIANHYEEMDEKEVEFARDLGGPEAERHASASISDVYSLHLKDALKEKISVVFAEIEANMPNLEAGLKKVEQQFGVQPAAVHQPDPTHPVETPSNPKSKTPSKQI